MLGRDRGHPVHDLIRVNVFDRRCRAFLKLVVYQEFHIVRNRSRDRKGADVNRALSAGVFRKTI